MLLFGACQPAPPAPSPIRPEPTPAALLSVEGAACASPVPATFTGRFAEQGYVAYRSCRGVVRNRGNASVAVDVWVDALDAQGRPGGSCRTAAGTLAPGASHEWAATCPVTAAEVGFAVRLTDGGGAPLPTRTP